MGTTMSAIAPMVMKSAEFLEATTPRNPFKRGRSSLRDIDMILKQCDSMSHSQPAERVKLLLALCRAIRTWMTKKDGKTTGNSAFRRATMLKLGNQAFERLQYEEFARRKSGFQGNRPVKSLATGYANERANYLKNGKQFAYSATNVDHVMKSASVYPNIAMPAPFSQLTPQQFETIAKQYEEGGEDEFLYVKFFNKEERISKLLYIEDGYFYEGLRKRVDAGENVSYMYAIDKYGNIYGEDLHRAENVLGLTTAFNHSSFNAGKEVICAGMLKFSNGRLKYIDNNSGHYQPTKQNLIEALKLLEESGVDLYASVKVGCDEAHPTIAGKRVMNYYHNAAFFIRNPTMQPDSTA